jgi:hypothetical protein
VVSSATQPRDPDPERKVSSPCLVESRLECWLLCRELCSAMVFRVPGRGWVGDRHHRLFRSGDQGPCAPYAFPLSVHAGGMARVGAALCDKARGRAFRTGKCLPRGSRVPISFLAAPAPPTAVRGGPRQGIAIGNKEPRRLRRRAGAASCPLVSGGERTCLEHNQPS